jgi:hypothetical protein
MYLPLVGLKPERLGVNTCAGGNQQKESHG